MGVPGRAGSGWVVELVVGAVDDDVGVVDVVDVMVVGVVDVGVVVGVVDGSVDDGVGTVVGAVEGAVEDDVGVVVGVVDGSVDDDVGVVVAVVVVSSRSPGCWLGVSLSGEGGGRTVARSPV